MKNQKFSFLVELAGLQFNEVNSETSSWIMAMPLGKYQHSRYGTINITPDRAQRFADNVNKGVRGQQLDIDYDHKEYNGEAAGWVMQAEPRSDGLWILVEWTQKAIEAIKSKAYRYFSPEFEDMWSDPRTGEKIKDVLAGGGITNRPFLKGIQPLNLSEFYDESIVLKENGMDPDQVKALATMLGLDENATPDMLFGALMMSLNSALPAPELPPETSSTESTEDATNNGELVSTNLSEIANNPFVKKLTEKLGLQAKQLSDMITGNRVKKLSEEARTIGRELTTVAETSITKLLAESPSDAYSDELVKLLTEMLTNVGPITGELGGGHKRLNDDNVDTTKKFSEAIDKIMKDDPKLSYAEAAITAAAMDNDAFADHRNGSYIKEGE